MNLEYANAYAEVLEILKYVSEEDYKKIPSKKIKLFETNANINHEFQYDPSETLDENNASKRTKAIIAILFRDYWATDIQREKILRKQSQDIINLEKEKSEKYKTTDLFTKKENTEKIIQNTELTKKEDTFFKKIINKIKSLFKK